MPITHPFVSAKGAASDTTLVDGPRWNAEHTLTNELNFPAMASPPTAPSSGAHLFAQEVVPGCTKLRISKVSLQDTDLQDSISMNRVMVWRGSNNAVVALGAANLTFAGTAAAVTPASGSAKAQTQRVSYATTATAGALTTAVSPNAGACPVFRGGVNGEGGFNFSCRVALNTLVAGNRFFWGLAASTTTPTNIDPVTATTPARVGLACNANTGNMQVVRSDGTTAATIDLGANFPVDTTSLYELRLFARPHDGTSAGNIGYRVRRYTTNSNAAAFDTSGTLSTNLPAATTLLHPWGFMTNNATASICGYHFISAAIESDF